MQTYPEKTWKLWEIAILCVVVPGMVLTLYYVFTKLRFFFGVDYRMFHIWQAGWMKTGVFYPKDTVFFNFPLTVAAFGPYGFLPVDMAVKLKFIQTAALSVYAMHLLMKIRPGLAKQANSALFAMVIIGATFFLTQLFYLNIYVEVTVCLMASLYHDQKGNERLSAFFLCLAVIFKVFLFPMLLAPLLVRRYRLFGWHLVFMAFFVVLSLALFGPGTHVDMLTAMSGTYSKMRLHGITYPFVSDGFAGWQDVFNKLMVLGLIGRDIIMPLTLTLAGLYGCLFLYTCFLIYGLAGSGLNNRVIYANVFASLLILSLGFNFRFDHGTLFLCAVPFFADPHMKNRGLMVTSLTVLTLSRLFFVEVMKAVGLVAASKAFAAVFYVLSFQFIGINLLVFLVVQHWIVREREEGQHGI